MRLESLQKGLEKLGVAAYLITDVRNIYYFTGFRDITDATMYLVVTPNSAPILLVSPLSFIAAKENAQNCEVLPVVFGEKIIGNLIDVLKNLGGKSLHFDSLLAQTYLEIKKKINMKLVPNPELILSLRKIKDEAELVNIRKAANLAVIGLKSGVEFIRPGIKEYEVAAQIEYAMRTLGSEGASFETIVASGPRSVYPHGLANNRVIQKGDLVTIDLGATYAGYCSDLTRTVVVGGPSLEQSKILNLVFQAHTAALQAFRAGIKAKDVDAAARKVLTEAGYGKYFIHGLGHGVGLSVHELPVLSINSKDVLEDGNVVTNEPGIYIENFGGVRIEDLILIRKDWEKY